MTGGELPEFLLARYAEDEAIARDVQFQALAGRPFIAITAGGTGVRRLTDAGWWLDDLTVKRQIVEWVASTQSAAGEPPGMCEDDAAGLTYVLRLLALPYAGHPDYREEWKP